VLLCQRQSAILNRRDHRAYGTTLLIAGVMWFLVGLGLPSRPRMAAAVMVATPVAEVTIPCRVGFTQQQRGPFVEVFELFG
jgi:hypothetical protein